MYSSVLTSLLAACFQLFFLLFPFFATRGSRSGNEISDFGARSRKAENRKGMMSKCYKELFFSTEKHEILSSVGLKGF
jgi:hypothetical protein